MSLRINKLLSDVGIGSRREVEKYIIDGRVMLNGERAELSDIVVEDDVVTLDGEELPVNDLLREALSMKHYLEAQSEDAVGRRREGGYGNDSLRSNKPAKGGPRRMRSDRFGDEPQRAQQRRPKGGAPFDKRKSGKDNQRGGGSNKW